MRITSKGQVTIPANIREEAGLLPGSEVEFAWDGTAVRILRARSERSAGRGARIVRHLRGRSTIDMTTDEILALTRAE
jgi:AbrB family looped-hinge helix DNA binding protein